MDLPITLTIWNRLLSLEPRALNVKWADVVKMLSVEIKGFLSIYHCQCSILQEPFTITEAQLVQFFYIYDHDYYPCPEDYVREIIVLVKILWGFLFYYTGNEKIFFYNEGQNPDFSLTQPEIRDLVKVGKHKEKVLQELKGKLLPLRKIGLKKELMVELHYLPPNDLLKCGGIKYQEGLDHFNSSQGL